MNMKCMPSPQPQPPPRCHCLLLSMHFIPSQPTIRGVSVNIPTSHNNGWVGWLLACLVRHHNIFHSMKCMLGVRAITPDAVCGWQTLHRPPRNLHIILTQNWIFIHKCANQMPANKNCYFVYLFIRFVWFLLLTWFAEKSFSINVFFSDQLDHSSSDFRQYLQICGGRYSRFSFIL